MDQLHAVPVHRASSHPRHHEVIPEDPESEELDSLRGSRQSNVAVPQPTVPQVGSLTQFYTQSRFVSVVSDGVVSAYVAPDT